MEALGTRPAVYLAGKIDMNDWRHVAAPRCGEAWTYAINDRASPEPLPPWPVLRQAIHGVMDYTGPFFISCDHGCFHGPGSHGAGQEGCTALDKEETRAHVLRQCEVSIGRSDLVFAWLDTTTAYGTLVEIGFARAARKSILIGMPEDANQVDELSEELWFALKCADLTVSATTPVEITQRLAKSAELGYARDWVARSFEGDASVPGVRILDRRVR